MTEMLTLASMKDIHPLFYAAPVGGVAALVMARAFKASVMSRTEGNDEQKRIAQAVRDGAMAYLFRQYKVVGVVFVALVIVLAILSLGLGVQPVLSMVGVPLAGLLSGLCGWFGMRMATQASARTAAAAQQSLNDGLTVAFRAGAVMGLNVVGFAILDVSFWFFVLNAFGEQILGAQSDIRVITTIMLSFAMGASTQALFARVGGGIYTKAADVGADLVGKVEAGIPEDDARNPATIADNVGDNVGDVAGMGADLYESYYGSILASAFLGAAAAFTLANATFAESTQLALLLAVIPLALAGIGILCSIAGIFTVRTKENANFAGLLHALEFGVRFASGLIVIAAFAVPYLILGDNALAKSAGITFWGIGGAIVCGLIAGLVIAKATEYYTSYEYKPTQEIAHQALTGPATVVISGIAAGMRSTWASLLTVVVAIIGAFVLNNGSENFLLGLYGVAIAAVGMLATLGITLATDAYGPIADNAGGNAEMAGLPPHVRQRTDMLDSLGNTTAAIGKGFAIGSAALTALALFAGYVQVVQVQQTTQGENFARSFDYSKASFVGGAGKDRPHAIYEGFGQFVLVLPGEGSSGADKSSYVDGAMLLDKSQFPNPDDYSHLEPNTVFPVALPTSGYVGKNLKESRRLRLQGQTMHGDHAHAYDFEIVAARPASIKDTLHFYDVTLTNPKVLGGLFIGVLLTFLFCAMTMSAVGRAAYAMMGECRRQFAIMRNAFRSQGMSDADIADPEKWPKRVTVDGKEYPDYANCVSISTAGAQKEMVVPSVLAITVPLAVGLILNVPGVMGMLAGGLASGFAVAIYMANAGGAWDNAKKYIEKFGRITADQFLDDSATAEKVPAPIRDAIRAKAQEMRASGQGSKYVYGKGSDDHKATVVGDTIGDPFKDTSGPSLNILIKLISIVSVVFAGFTVKFGPVIGSMLGLN
ncbi:MAG: sodium/proton-translocating pyrophosphatase [Phycisphaeraceae bacterium]|nr:sodium/proton-translocating pyrophosphatase [Phycisphaeraceae bacterium]